MTTDSVRLDPSAAVQVADYKGWRIYVTGRGRFVAIAPGDSIEGLDLDADLWSSSLVIAKEYIDKQEKATALAKQLKAKVPVYLILGERFGGGLTAYPGTYEGVNRNNATPRWKSKHPEAQRLLKEISPAYITLRDGSDEQHNSALKLVELLTQIRELNAEVSKLVPPRLSREASKPKSFRATDFTTFSRKIDIEKANTLVRQHLKLLGQSAPDEDGA